MRFYYLWGCSASKGPRRKLFRYLLGYCVEKRTGQDRRCIVLELVFHFEPRPQNRIIVPLKDSFQNFGRAPPVLFMWEPFPGGIQEALFFKTPCAYRTKQSQWASVIESVKKLRVVTHVRDSELMLRSWGYNELKLTNRSAHISKCSQVLDYFINHYKRLRPSDTGYNFIIVFVLKYTVVFETYFSLETAGHHDSSAAKRWKATLENSNLYAIDKNLDFTSAHFDSNVVPTSAPHEPVCACQRFGFPSRTFAHFGPL